MEISVSNILKNYFGISKEEIYIRWVIKNYETSMFII